MKQANCHTNRFRCALRGINSRAFAEAEAFLKWNNSITLSPPWKPPSALLGCSTMEVWRFSPSFSPSSPSYSLELWRAEWDVLPVQAALKSMTVTHHVKPSYKWHLHCTQIFEPVLSEITRCLKNSISLLLYHFLSPVAVLSVEWCRPIFQCRTEKLGYWLDAATNFFMLLIK